jgi:hypothetical protein
MTSWCTIMNVAVMVMAFLFFDFAGAASQPKAFTSGEEAVNAFIKALKEESSKEILVIFGTDANDLMYSGDAVLDRLRREIFIKAYDEQHRLETDSDKLILIVGKIEWPFPIPLRKQQQQWIFDTAAGLEEILNRRIGRDEINTIQVMHAIVDAQREYAMKDHDSDGLLEYAQTLKSDPGKKNGLYWETKEGEEPSPMGVLVARAKKLGYGQQEATDEPQPYFGYYYRLLTAQGKNAAGGAFEYIVKNNMIGGFAVIAWPADYGNSGVMTFIVNHNDVVYQKDLGEDTDKEVDKIVLFDPNETWTKVQ